MNPELVSTKQSNHLYELGLSQLSSEDFYSAITNLRKASELFLKEENYEYFLACQNNLILMYVEMQNLKAVETIRQEMADLIWKKNLKTQVIGFYYCMGFCSLREKEYAKARVQFEQALSQNLKAQKEALAKNNLKGLLKSAHSMCDISYGFVYLYIETNQIPFAIEELKNFKLTRENFIQLYMEAKNNPESEDISRYLEVLKPTLPNIEFLYNLMQAEVLRIEGKHDSAEELYWLCYQQSRQNISQKYLTFNLLYWMGINYIAKDEYEQAFTFLNLAKKSVNPELFKEMSKMINEALEKLREKTNDDHDMIVDWTDKMITEKEKGQIDFKNQFVLLDMLKLFFSNPGVVYTKEDLVRKIWDQQYDPSVHDNKIYVTVKRLRDLLEPDTKKPKYLFRTKTGYFLSKRTKILFKKSNIKQRGNYENKRSYESEGSYESIS